MNCAAFQALIAVSIMVAGVSFSMWIGYMAGNVDRMSNKRAEDEYNRDKQLRRQMRDAAEAAKQRLNEAEERKELARLKAKYE